MKEGSFVNKSKCTVCAKKLREWAKSGGLEDLQTLSDKIIVSPDECENAADQFEYAAEKDGAYFCNIIKHPFFTANQIRQILSIL